MSIMDPREFRKRDEAAERRRALTTVNTLGWFEIPWNTSGETAPYGGRYVREDEEPPKKGTRG